VRAAERDEEARQTWRTQARLWKTEDLVFLDESGCNTTFHLRYGRAPRGQRLEASVPRNWKTNTTIVGALALDGWQAMIVEGAMDRPAFDAFIEHLLVPWLRPGQIVILDNLSTHKSETARRLVEAKGCRWVFLPTYSPDFNPIEMMWSKLKAHLRKAAARTQETLETAISKGLGEVSRQDAQGWFNAAGFSPENQSL
jgi:transposase